MAEDTRDPKEREEGGDTDDARSELDQDASPSSRDDAPLSDGALAALRDAGLSDALDADAAHPAPPDSIPSSSRRDSGATQDEGIVDGVEVRALLRRALRPPKEDEREVLAGVQRRIRSRSRGKFYGDGWSTSDAPHMTYIVTSLVMLVITALVLTLLLPWTASLFP